MKDENKKYLERFRSHYKTWVQAQFIGHIELVDRKRMLEIAREEWEPNYRACVTCPEDICLLINYVFTQMDKEPKMIVEPALKLAEEGEAKMTFPKVAVKPKNRRRG